jgi:signal transduction histidine kinase
MSAAVLAASLAEIATAGLLLSNPWERPSGASFMSLYLTRAATYTALGLTVDWAVWRTWRARAAVARLSTDLARAPDTGALEQSLSVVLGDPHLNVAYPVAAGAPVSADGRPAPAPDPGQVTTTLERGGEVVALVRHAPSALSPDALAARIGAAARLAVDNERMRATLLAQVEHLKASRARIVAASDAERRHLERDLHDGAQQRLLALTYELRMARADAVASGDIDRARALSTALEQAQAAVAELRTIAHGIHPAILSEAGLGPALLALADAATIPVEVLDLPDVRLPEATERAAYHAVARAIELAESSESSHLQVRISREGDYLVLRMDPAGGLTFQLDVIDRIGALGGDLRIEDGILHVEVPCA